MILCNLAKCLDDVRYEIEDKERILDTARNIISDILNNDKHVMNMGAQYAEDLKRALKLLECI